MPDPTVLTRDYFDVSMHRLVAGRSQDEADKWGDERALYAHDAAQRERIAALEAQVAALTPLVRLGLAVLDARAALLARMLPSGEEYHVISATQWTNGIGGRGTDLVLGEHLALAPGQRVRVVRVAE